ncbi:hypothetical protein NORO109296_26175 [Nocardiopsis rhodophaea]
MRMNEILPGHVQEFVRNCQKKGLAPSTIHRIITVLSAIFSTALVNQIVFIHPCKGVVLPRMRKLSNQLRRSMPRVLPGRSCCPRPRGGAG